MTNNDNSEVYEEGDSSSVVVEEHSTTSKTVKKPKKGGLVKTLLAVAAIAVVGGLGWYVFTGGGNSAPPAKTVAKAPKKEVPKVEEKPVEATPAPVEVAPTTTPEVTGIIPNTAIDPLTGQPLPVDNSIPPSVGIDPLAPTTIDPLAATPAPVSPSEVAPAVVASTTPAPVVEPAVIAPVVQPSSNGDLVAQISGAVTDALNPIIKRLDSVESRLSNLESRRSSSSIVSSDDRASRNAVAPTAPRRHSATPVKKKRPAAPAPVRNTIEVLTPVATSVTTQVTTVEAKPVLSCQISAVVHGSAWLKNSDGSFKGYAVGDTLPDGQKITAITPDKGIQVGSKTWNCK